MTSDQHAEFQSWAELCGLVIEERRDANGFPGSVLVRTRKIRPGETPRYIPLP